MPSTMNRLGRQLSAGTQHLAQQAVTVAQAAGASLVAGLRTCDERNASLNQFELRIEHDQPRSSKSRSGVLDSLHSIPSTAMALPANDASSEANTWGSQAFEFTLRLEHKGPSAGCLVAAAHRSGSSPSESSRGSVAIRCRWRRKIGGQTIEVPSIFGTLYPISIDDIAATIVVEATSLDSTIKGTAFGEIGPFDLDVATRKLLEDYLSVGATRFPIHLAAESHSFENDGDLLLHVSTEELRVVQPGPMNVGYVKEWSGKFGSVYPKVQLNYSNPTAFELSLSESDVLFLTTMSRSQRDLLALTVRCFHGRQWAIHSALLQAVGLGANKQLIGEGLPSSSEVAVPVDLLVLVQRLNAQLYNSLDKQEKCTKERDRAQTEKNALEQDISSTIEVYQRLLSQSATEGGAGDTKSITLDMSHRAAQVGALETRLKEAKVQSEKYIEELELLRRDYRKLQARVANDAMQTPSNTFMTNSKIADLKKDKFMQSTTFGKTEFPDQDTFRTVDLRQHLGKLQEAHNKLLLETEKKDSLIETLRTEIPTMDNTMESDFFTKEKAALEKQMKKLENENKDLSDNFLYIKAKFDALRSSQLQTEDKLAHSTGVSQQAIAEAIEDRQRFEKKCRDLQEELRVVTSKLDVVTGEKNRYFKKCETLSHDLEKCRTSLEAKTDMLLTMNKKISDEKTSVEEKLKNLESTLLDQRGTIHSLETTLRDSPNIAEMEETLALKDEKIEKLEKENQQLRSRIRKLAASS